MYRQGAATTKGQWLAFQYVVTGFDAQLTFWSQMLLQGDDKMSGRGATRSGTPLDWVFISGG